MSEEPLTRKSGAPYGAVNREDWTRSMEFIENGFPEPSDEYLRPTEFFDYGHPAVAAFTDETVEGTSYG